MKIVLALLPLFLTGCITLPGDVTLHESKAEGTKTLSMNPAWLSGGKLKLSLFKELHKNDDKVTLEAYVMSAASIDTKDSLVINIDGQVTRLTSIDERTDINFIPGGGAVAGHNESSKRYEVDLAFVRKMLAGKVVHVKVNMAKTYEEDTFDGGMMTARDSFAKFLTELNKQRTPASVR